MTLDPTSPVYPAYEQIKRLADFIASEIPGEPSQSEGAVDTAIRLLRKAQQPWSEEDCNNRLREIGAEQEREDAYDS